MLKKELRSTLPLNVNAIPPGFVLIVLIATHVQGIAYVIQMEAKMAKITGTCEKCGSGIRGRQTGAVAVGYVRTETGMLCMKCSKPDKKETPKEAPKETATG